MTRTAWRVRRTPAAWHAWLVAVALLACGAGVYWLTGGAERFESWFALPSPAALGLDGDAARPLRDWWPDLCWAFFVGVAARELAWALWLRVDLATVLVVASSWELGQAAGWLPGHFSGVDLCVSLAAGAMAFAWPARRGEDRG